MRDRKAALGQEGAVAWKGTQLEKVLAAPALLKAPEQKTYLDHGWSLLICRII